MHGFDELTPVEETLETLDTLVRSGKVRYIAGSNFSGWHPMKSLAISQRYGWARYVAQQVYYSLVGREYELELLPLAVDQKIGALVWSPLGWGRLTGKIRRGQPLPAQSRLHKTAEMGPQAPEEYIYKVVDAIDAIARETGKTVPQVALNRLLRRPTVSSVILGARNDEQLRQNLAATAWKLTPEQVAKLDAASEFVPTYPYWHQRGSAERIPLHVPRPDPELGGRECASLGALRTSHLKCGERNPAGCALRRFDSCCYPSMAQGSRTPVSPATEPGCNLT